MLLPNLFWMFHALPLPRLLCTLFCAIKDAFIVILSVLSPELYGFDVICMPKMLYNLTPPRHCFLNSDVICSSSSQNITAVKGPRGDFFFSSCWRWQMIFTALPCAHQQTPSKQGECRVRKSQMRWEWYCQVNELDMLTLPTNHKSGRSKTPNSATKTSCPHGCFFRFAQSSTHHGLKPTQAAHANCAQEMMKIA